MEPVPVPSIPYLQMDYLCQEIRNNLVGYHLKDVVAFDAAKFILIFAKNEDEKRLLISLKKPFIRFHLVYLHSKCKGSPHKHRLQDFLSGYLLKAINLINQDRILQLEFSNGTEKKILIVEFFSRHPNYYVALESGEIVFSLHPVKEKVYHLPLKSVPKDLEIHTLISSKEMELRYDSLEEAYSFWRDKNTIGKELELRLKKIISLQDNLQKDLDVFSQSETLQHEGELLKANFSLLKKGMKEIKVLDWLSEGEKILSLDPLKTSQELVSERFKKSKKYQKGIVHLEAQLIKNFEKKKKFQEALLELDKIVDRNELDFFIGHWEEKARTKSKSLLKEKIPSKPYHEYVSSTGSKIWVGKKAKDNEILTFSLARGSDWWLHVQGYPGSHVVIKTLKGAEPDSETIQDAIQLALYYSKAKMQGEGEVCVTQRKFVSRFGKGVVGKVQISKHKNVYAKLDPVRMEGLKNRKSS